MNRSVLGWVVLFVLAIGGSAVAWVWLAGGSGEPSTELTTPTIAGSVTTTAAAPSASETTEPPSTTEPASADRAFVIDATQSTVSFEIDEELQGSPNHVVGTTDQVAGQVHVDVSDLSTARFSRIVVNARTFVTDSERRDRAIRGPIILNSASDEFELITFDVMSIEGLSGSVEVGDTVEFTVVGDLSIRGVTQEVGFETTVTWVDDSTIDGEARTTVLRSDFGIGIPSIPGIANVTDEVLLAIDFVAVSG